MIIDSGIVTGSFQVIGNTEITGSLKVTGGLTGSIFGTASYANNADTVDGRHASEFVLNSATSSLATQTYVNTAVSNLVDAAPGTLDTLNELAAALGDDPNFATTIATSIGTKQNQLNGTGFVKASGTTISYDNSTYTPTSRTLTINGTSFDLSADRSWSIASGVTSFNTRTGAITLSSGDVTTALGYTPYNATNPNGYISSYTETDPTVPSHVKSITTTNISNWNTAFGWGNHALAGYALANHTHIISPVAESSVSPNGISIQAGPGSSNPQGWSYPYGTKLSAIIGAGRSFEIMSTTYPDGQLALRTLGGGGTWDSWKTVLDSNNYSTYVPTLTGGGASGTWGIGITGNAGTITSQANSATINCSTGVTGNDIVRRDGNGYIYANHINFNTGESENPTINSFFTSNGDGWSRKSTLAHVKNSIRGVADGTWGINITGNAGTATGLTTNYIGGQQLNPQTYFNNGVGLKVAMTAKVGVWSDTLWINGYSGGDVLQMCAMHFQRNGTPRSYISVQASTATSYGTAYEYVTEYNSPYALNMNQYVRTTDTPTFSELYTNGWFINNDSNEGMYNQTTTQHWSSNTNGYWDASSTTNATSGVVGIRLYAGGHVNTLRGYFYSDGSGIGILNNQGGWSVLCYQGASYGVELRGICRVTGDVVAYYSDERLKDKKGSIENALDKIKSLNGFYYTNNETAKALGYEGDELQIGLSAQEVQAIAPEIVTLAPVDSDRQEDGTVLSKSGENYLTVNYAKLVPVLVEAIKEQQTQIDELKQLVKQLTNK